MEITAWGAAMIAVAVGVLIALGVCLIVACRLEKMKRGETDPRVALQHGVMALGMFVAAILQATPYAGWSVASAATGSLLFFVLSTHRWRETAPAGTESKPMELDSAMWSHVSGGKGEQ